MATWLFSFAIFLPSLVLNFSRSNDPEGIGMFPLVESLDGESRQGRAHESSEEESARPVKAKESLGS